MTINGNDIYSLFSIALRALRSAHPLDVEAMIVRCREDADAAERYSHIETEEVGYDIMDIITTHVDARIAEAENDPDEREVWKDVQHRCNFYFAS